MADTKILIEVGAKNTTQRTFDQVQKSMKQTQVATGAANRQFRQMRGMMGQMGHQVQDVAVQLQMGTNAMIVMGQQGGQIASLFGPFGAIAGAVVSVGAALAMATGVLRDADTEARILREKIDDLAGSWDDLTDAQKRYYGFIAGKQLQQMSTQLASLENELSSINDALQAPINWFADDKRRAQLKAYTDRQIELGAEIDDLKGKMGEIADPTSDSTASIAELITKLEIEVATLGMAEDAIVRYNAALNGATQGQLSQMYAHQEAIRLFREEKEEKEKAIKAAEKAAKDEAKALADAEAVLQKALLNEIYEGANEQQKLEDVLQKALLNEIYDNAKEQQKVEAEVAQSLADEQAKRDAQELADAKAAADALNEVERQKIRSNIEAWEEEQDTKARYTKAKEQMDIQTINNAANYMGQLADGLEEGSSAYKAAFLVQKGLNIASIIMSAQSASAAALAPPPIGLGPVYGASLAASIQAQAAMNVGMVAGTTLASFEGGGITFDGIRAGGVDGKGGRMAVVHPNEKITDLEKEQPASGNSVTINIQAIDTQTGTEFLMRNRDIIFNAANRSANNKGRRL